MSNPYIRGVGFGLSGFKGFGFGGLRLCRGLGFRVQGSRVLGSGV